MSYSLSSLPEGYRAVVFGAGGALGGAFLRLLEADPRCGPVFAASRGAKAYGRARPLRFDLTDPDSIEAAAHEAARDGPLHLVLAATGVLHGPDGLAPEKSWRDLDAGNLETMFRLNAVGPALIARAVLPKLARGSTAAPEKAVFAALSARVGSISDNRLGGWHAYRASKAALNQIIRTCAIELARKAPGALCIGLHPGTVDSQLSAPFQRGVPEGKLFAPDYSARSLLEVIDRLTPDHSGRVFDWAGEEVRP